MAEPFGYYAGDRIGLSGGMKCGEAAVNTISGLFILAANEGLACLARPEPYGEVGCIHAKYSPSVPQICVNKKIPWPQFRWFLAVAIGYHFTRHHHAAGGPHGPWRAAAESWATTYLATCSANQLATSWHELPDNSVTRKLIRKSGSAFPDPASNQQREQRSSRCRGSTAPGECLEPVEPGTAFCCQHRAQAVSVAAMGSLVADLAATLPSS